MEWNKKYVIPAGLMVIVKLLSLIIVVSIVALVILNIFFPGISYFVELALSSLADYISNIFN